MFGSFFVVFRGSFMGFKNARKSILISILSLLDVAVFFTPSLLELQRNAWQSSVFVIASATCCAW